MWIRNKQIGALTGMYIALSLKHSNSSNHIQTVIQLVFYMYTTLTVTFTLIHWSMHQVQSEVQYLAQMHLDSFFLLICGANCANRLIKCRAIWIRKLDFTKSLLYWTLLPVHWPMESGNHAINTARFCNSCANWNYNTKQSRGVMMKRFMKSKSMQAFGKFCLTSVLKWVSGILPNNHSMWSEVTFLRNSELLEKSRSATRWTYSVTAVNDRIPLTVHHKLLVITEKVGLWGWFTWKKKDMMEFLKKIISRMSMLISANLLIHNMQKIV